MDTYWWYRSQLGGSPSTSQTMTASASRPLNLWRVENLMQSASRSSTSLESFRPHISSRPARQDLSFRSGERMTICYGFMSPAISILTIASTFSRRSSDVEQR